MKTYIITTGKSVLTKFDDNIAEISKNVEQAITFDNIGDAMRMASKVNDLINTYSFRVVSK